MKKKINLLLQILQFESRIHESFAFRRQATVAKDGTTLDHA